MVFNERVVAAIGYRGHVQIGRAYPIPGRRRWRVEIYNRGILKAYSRVEVRELLTVHGADRVMMQHAVEAVWPALPATLLAEPSEKKSSIVKNLIFDLPKWQSWWGPRA